MTRTALALTAAVVWMLLSVADVGAAGDAIRIKDAEEQRAQQREDREKTRKREPRLRLHRDNPEKLRKPKPETQRPRSESTPGTRPPARRDQPKRPPNTERCSRGSSNNAGCKNISL